VGLVQHYIQLVLGVTHQWHGADHSPPSSAKVKCEWSYTVCLLNNDTDYFSERPANKLAI
jgi:hypothetical protein